LLEQPGIYLLEEQRLSVFVFPRSGEQADFLQKPSQHRSSRAMHSYENYRLTHGGVLKAA
jgi:hypothetical protein